MKHGFPPINLNLPVCFKVSRRQVFPFHYTNGHDDRVTISWTLEPNGKLEMKTDGYGVQIFDDGEFGWTPILENFDIMDAIAGTDTPEIQAERKAKIDTDVRSHPLFGSF